MVQLDEDIPSRLRAGSLLGRPHAVDVVVYYDSYPGVLDRRLPPGSLVEKDEPLPILEHLVAQALVALRQKVGTVARGEYAQQFG